MSATTLTITKLDYAGRPVAAYPGTVVYADEEQVVARTVWAEPAWSVGPLTLETGGILVERYYPARWYNVMALYIPTGVLLGWYCNITRPAEVTADTIRWSDMALDLLVLPDGTSSELDRREFAALPLSAAERRQAEEALQALQAAARAGRSPFQGVPPGR
ncbi:MAG: DUF402 domain-containing protein [Chloroflexi bacterium]|nr:DUF402 domain-containing protein [Chloroflexota bacterium]